METIYTKEQIEETKSYLVTLPLSEILKYKILVDIILYESKIPNK